MEIVSGVLYFLIVALIVVVVVLVVLYLQQENVIKYLNSSENGKTLLNKVYGSSIEALKKELELKCNSEKIDLKTGAETIMQQKLNDKDIEIKSLKDSNLNMKDIEDKLKACEQEKLKIVEDMNAAFKLALETQEKSSVKLPTPWTCGIEGVYVPIRVNENKELECMALDGKNCLWRTSVETCQTVRDSPPGEIKPLVCGEMHKSVYGDDGYSRPNNWCAIGAKAYNLGK